jgi:leucyl aminopeptidase (aminopeptidase T)
MRKLALLLTAPLFMAASLAAQARDLDHLAHRIVATSLAIKPGEVVVINGGKHTIPLMEALAVEAQKAGGMVTIFLSSDRVIRSFNMDVPEQYLEQEPRFYGEWLKRVDVVIGLPPASDIKALDAGVPAARLAKQNRANEFLIPMLDGMKFRELDITYPTPARGASFGLDGKTYVDMVWGAMRADHGRIAERASALRGMLQDAKAVRVTSPSGTDITFAVGDRPIFSDAGTVTSEAAKGKKAAERTVSFPAGTVTVAPLETSATGKVVVPRAQCRFQVMTGVSFEVHNGQMDSLKATRGSKCYEDLAAGSSGPINMFGFFSLGLNPAWPAHEERGAAYYPSPGAGIVYLGFGDNQFLGGANQTVGNFGFAFPITKATVWIDGKKVVDAGKLVF